MSADSLDESKNYKILKQTFLGIYQNLRDICYRYIKAVYKSENISDMTKLNSFLPKKV